VAATTIRILLRTARLGPAPAADGPNLDLSSCRLKRTGSSPATSLPSRRPGSGRSLSSCSSSSAAGGSLSARQRLTRTRRGSPEQARNLAPDLDARASPVRFLIRDRDTKFSRSFDEVVRSEGARVIVTPFQAPNANAHPRARDRDDPGRVPRPDAHPEVGGISIERSGPTPSTTTADGPIAPLASPHRWPKPGFRSRSRSVNTRDVRRLDLLGGLIHEYYGAAA
jgi:hypothetical protein